jgi:hypothetical protein
MKHKKLWLSKPNNQFISVSYFLLDLNFFNQNKKLKLITA